MTLDPRFDDNLKFLRRELERRREDRDHYERLANGDDETVPMRLAYWHLWKAAQGTVAALETIEAHMLADADKSDWLNIRLPKNALLDAAYKRADHIAADYGWQDEHPAFREYVNQMYDCLDECLQELVCRAVEELGKPYMDSFVAEVFDEWNHVSPEAIEEGVRRNVGEE